MRPVDWRNEETPVKLIGEFKIAFQGVQIVGQGEDEVESQAKNDKGEKGKTCTLLAIFLVLESSQSFFDILNTLALVWIGTGFQLQSS